MSLEKFRKAMAASGLPKNDRKWMPIRVEKYAQFHGFAGDGPFDVTGELVVEFLKDMKSRRAVEHVRDALGRDCVSERRECQVPVQSRCWL